MERVENECGADMGNRGKNRGEGEDETWRMPGLLKLHGGFLAN